jgi:hypothetical protein
MTPAQTAHLVEQIVGTWPTGVRGFVWTKRLADLDYTPALGVYEYLADHDERPPTIARFLALYWANTPDYGWQPPDDSGPIVPPHLGRQIAYQAYVNECHRLGRTPNHQHFLNVINATIKRHPSSATIEP